MGTVAVIVYLGVCGERRWKGICFFFNDTATTEIYTLSLHDALPIWSYSEMGKKLIRLSVIVALDLRKLWAK